MSIFWQAKIWGLLHDPVLKALHSTGRGGNSYWQSLAVMHDWVENGWNPEESGGTAMKHILLADYLTSASGAAIGSLSTSANPRALKQSRAWVRNFSSSFWCKTRI